jgi:hypothetical protein
MVCVKVLVQTVCRKQRCAEYLPLMYALRGDTVPYSKDCIEMYSTDVDSRQRLTWQTIRMLRSEQANYFESKYGTSVAVWGLRY